MKLQQRLQWKLDGKTRWLEILKSDEELVSESGTSLDTIRSQAAEILQSHKSTDKLFNALFEAYRKEKNTLNRIALGSLLKNRCKVPQKEEDSEKFAKRRRKIEIQIERLQEQLDGRLPEGRDLTNEKWFETLEIVASSASTDTKEVRSLKARRRRSWQDRLLTEPSAVPFPT